MLPFSAFSWGQQFVSAGLAGIINSASPIVVFLITALWTRHERAGAERLFGTVIGLGGVLGIIGIDALAGLGAHVLAEAVLLLGTLGYAMSAVHGRHFAGVAPEVTAAGTLGLAALALVPIAFLLEDPLSLEPTREALLSIVYLGVAGSGLTFMIYFYLVARVGSLNTVTASYLRAGFAVLFGMMILSEPLTWRVVLGLAGVIIGVAAISGQFSRIWARLRGELGRRDDDDRPAPIIR
ncbi:MAG: DMT family transporter, partial [Pseudomonadota bacterium]|nr:DMT family transporter [Pseudomonadota bacterium]